MVELKLRPPIPTLENFRLSLRVRMPASEGGRYRTEDMGRQDAGAIQPRISAGRMPALQNRG